MTDTTPDVAAILTRVRAEVRAQRQARAGYDQGTAELSTLERQLQRCLEQLEITRVVSAHWPLAGRTWPQRAVALINKLVRRYLRWYINPIVEQQNSYNDIVARTLRLQVEAYAELRSQLASLERRNAGDDQPSPTGEAPATRHTGEASSASPESATFDDLQALVEQQARTEPPAALTDMQLRPLLARLALHQEVRAHWPLEGQTLLHQAIALLNRLVRRYLRWYVNPIVEQQNAFNTAVSATTAALFAVDAEVRFRLAAYRALRRPGPDA